MANRLSGFGGHEFQIRKIRGLWSDSIGHKHDIVGIDGHSEGRSVIPVGSRMLLQDPNIGFTDSQSVFRGPSEEDRALDLTGELVPSLGVAGSILENLNGLRPKADRRITGLEGL